MTDRKFSFSAEAEEQLEELQRRLNVASGAAVVRKALQVLDYMTSGHGDLFTRRSADKDVACFRDYDGAEGVRDLFEFLPAKTKDGVYR